MSSMMQKVEFVEVSKKLPIFCSNWNDVYPSRQDTESRHFCPPPPSEQWVNRNRWPWLLRYPSGEAVAILGIIPEEYDKNNAIQTVEYCVYDVRLQRSDEDTSEAHSTRQMHVNRSGATCGAGGRSCCTSTDTPTVVITTTGRQLRQHLRLGSCTATNRQSTHGQEDF